MTSLGEWYQVQIIGTLRKLKTSLILVSLITILGSMVSYQIMSTFFSTEREVYSSQEEVDERLADLKKIAGMPSDNIEITFGFVFKHNLQAVLLMMFFGIFSFGILGELAFVINIGVLSGLFAALDAFGLPALRMFLAGVLPHGIFEIPALILSGAGVCISARDGHTKSNKTMGKVLFLRWQNWAKMVSGLIFPGFIRCSVDPRVYITPRI